MAETDRAQEAPLVSVVIPSYNRARFVGDAIESVLGQTYRNVEIIVVNDGSTDETDDVMEQYANNVNVKYLKQANRGIPGARNTGIRQARGEYIAFLDSDDMWLPKKLEIQLQVFARDVAQEIGTVWSDTYLMDNSGTIKRSGVHVPREINTLSAPDVLKLLFLRNFITAGTAVVRRVCFDRVGLLDEALTGGSDDSDLWLRLAPHFKFKYVPIPLATVRLHGGNYSSIQRQGRENFVIMEKAIAANPELAALRGAKVGRLHYRLGIDYLEQGNRRKAQEHLWQVASYRPLALRALAAWALACGGSVGGWVLRTWLKVRTLRSAQIFA